MHNLKTLLTDNFQLVFWCKVETYFLETYFFLASNNFCLLNSKFWFINFSPRSFHVCVQQETSNTCLHSDSYSCFEDTQLPSNYYLVIYKRSISINLINRKEVFITGKESKAKANLRTSVESTRKTLIIYINIDDSVS